MNIWKYASLFEKRAADIYPPEWDNIERKFQVGDLIKMKGVPTYAIFMGYSFTGAEPLSLQNAYAYIHFVQRDKDDNGKIIYLAAPLLRTVRHKDKHNREHAREIFNTNNIKVRVLNHQWEIVAPRGSYELYGADGKQKLA